jgi:hypothetical protein
MVSLSGKIFLKKIPNIFHRSGYLCQCNLLFMTNQLDSPSPLPPNASDEVLLQYIKGGVVMREMARDYIADHLMPAIIKKTLSQGALEADAIEAAGMVLDTVLDTISKEAFVLKVSLSGYIATSVFHQWQKNKDKTPKYDSIELDNLRVNQILGIRQDEVDLMHKILKKFDPRCYKIFKLVYWKRYAMDAVAHEMGFQDASTATRERYKCIVKVRLYLEGLPKTNDFFKDMLNNE